MLEISLGDRGYMKKYLYGTTALAAVGLTAGPVSAAEPLHMELGGYYQQFFGFTDTGRSGEGEEISYQNAEIYFNMRGELDNGLKIGGRLELEGLESGDQIDQAYLILAGGFGELRIGAINSGRYSYGWNTDAPAVGVPINSGWMSTFLTIKNTTGSRFRSPGVSTVIDAGNDDQKITYFTPRFNGFQLTGSWTPTIGGGFTNGADVGTGTGGQNPGISSEAQNYSEAWDLGVSYSGAFQDVGVEVTAGVAGASAHTGAEAAGFDDYLSFNGGLALSAGGFSVAGSFAVVDEGQSQAANTVSTEGRSFNTGIGYSTGPWGFSLTYFNGQVDGPIVTPGDEENEWFAAAVAYTLGPGLKTSLTFLSVDAQDDSAAGANVGGNDTDARAIVLGIHAGF